MFFQPKFHRGTRPAAPPKARSGSLPLLHIQLDATSQRATIYRDLEREIWHTREGVSDDLHLSHRPKSESIDAEDHRDTREDYFDQRYRVGTAQQSTSQSIDRHPLGHLPAHSARPLSPCSHPQPLPTLKTPERTPHYHPYSVNHGHGTTPSLSSTTSKSSSSHLSFDSEPLLTPIRSYLHIPISPTSSIAPTRPLPSCPPQGISTSSPVCRPRKTKAPPPPPSMSIYASMPLPPLPPTSFTSRSRVPATASLHIRTKRSNRDSQATVRPSDIQARSRSRLTHHRETRPSLPIQSAIQEIDKDRNVQIYGEKEEDESEMPDLGLLSIFPMPPSRPSSPFAKNIRRISEGETDLRSKRLSSKSTIKPIRRAPPPPLPLLRFDLFSIDSDSDISADGVRSKISEADRIREQYLKGRRRT